MRIVVADDSALLREGLIGLLERQGHEVVGQAASAPELLAVVGRAAPEGLDVALVPHGTAALGADLLKAPGHIDHIGKKKPGPRTKTAPPKTCAHCQAEFTRRDGERLNAYTARLTCSRECAHAYCTTNRRNAA